MKIHSKKLLQYLIDKGVLGGTQEEISVAKIEWRKRYKREWRKNRVTFKEVRPTFSKQEYEGIVLRAEIFGLTPTGYTKQIVLTAQQETDLIPQKDKLLNILQLLSMADCAFNDNKVDESRKLLTRAELLLLRYLNIKQ